MLNPITGLYIHPPRKTPAAQTPTPQYSLVRLSATSTNDNWHQESKPREGKSSARRYSAPPEVETGRMETYQMETDHTAENVGDDGNYDDATAPQWVDYIRHMTHVQVPLSLAVAGGGGSAAIGSDSESSNGDGEPGESGEDDDGDNDDDDAADDDGDDDRSEFDATEAQVYPYRIRIWGLAASPGAGSSAVLASQHLTQRPERIVRMLVLFGWHEQGQQSSTTSQVGSLTTEGRTWEWMYGGGDPASRPDFGQSGAVPFPIWPQEGESLQRCSYCNTALRSRGDQSRCANNHAFGMLWTRGISWCRVMLTSTYQKTVPCPALPSLPREYLACAVSVGGGRYCSPCSNG